MGKEWLYWVGGGGGGAGRSSRRRGKIMSEEMKEAATSAGCMCAVFQLFDLHNFQSPNLNHQHNPSDNFHSNINPFLQEEATTTSKGVEAPRNSLELQEPVSLAIKQEENLNFPVGIQIKTSRTKLSSPRASNSKSRSDFDNISSENSSINSPGTKTPTLVARLMGLDLLPECNSPSISSSSPNPKIKSRLHQRKSSRSFFDDDSSRSLPETPRISSARRSDVEYHRHSLQINKENVNEENISPGSYARHFVKQVKDSVSRRVGLDITNTSKNREHRRRDENLILLKPTKKNPKNLSRFEGEISPDGKQCSPRFSSKNKPIISSGSKSPRVSLSSENHRPQGIVNPLKPKADGEISPILQEQKQQQKDSKKFGSSGKCGSSRLKKLPHQASDHAIRNKKEEPLLSKANLTEKKSKRTPLLSDILNVSGHTLLQVKKDPSPPPTKLPQKQVSDALSSKRSTQLSSKPSHSYKQLQLHPKNVPQDITNGCATALPGGASAEYGVYIQRILKRAGIIDKINPFTLVKWQNRSHPIDPSIFHHLELFHPTITNSAGGSGGRNTILSRRCNRKLIFQLVDELLDEILRPHFNLKPWISPICEDDRNYLLVDELCKKIDSFPAANCLVLEDIDSLIVKDLRKSQLNGGFTEEESVVCEIEGEILEWLVREAVATMGGGAAE
ncbi:hypothetical protein DH2020_040322 [Rehmannia glutinosa]|uniref:DUF4378 domain-containing protein n=1 Tax=Rehmannia glutinosa TaxID=99300 RepID=A0ABR0UT95_REHGL